MSARHMTIVMPEELEEVIRQRSRTNHRSLSKELIFLIETALGVCSDQVRETIHLIYKMNGEEDPISDDTARPA